MAGNLVTLAQLRTNALRLADLENATTRFPVLELNAYANLGIGEYYDLMIRSGGNWFQAPYTIVTDGQNTVYPLPQDFQRLQLAQIQLGSQFAGATTGDVNVGLESFTMRERPELSSSTPGWSGAPFAFMIHAGNVNLPNTTQSTINMQYAIEFLPKPAYDMKVQIFYTPLCPILQNDNDTIDGQNGFDLYVSAFMAKLCRVKDDLPTDAQDAIIAMVKERILAMGPHRDAFSSRRVSDVRRTWRRSRWNRGR